MAKNKQVPNKQPQPKVAQPTRPAPVTKPAAATTAAPRARGSFDKWLILFLVGFAFAVNLKTIQYDYTLDDTFFTKDNPFVKQGLSSVKDVFTHAAYYGVFKNHDASYRPFLLTSFAAEKEIFGFDPKVSHIVNLILFGTLLTVMFLLLRRLFREYSPFIPFFIVFLFSVHPIHTEVVASIKSRDEIMALLFSCLCLTQSIKYIDTDRSKHLILSGIYFFCALMSKESPITWVVIMPLTIYFFRNVPWSKIIRATVPYLIVAGIYMLMRINFVENDSGPVVILANNNALMSTNVYSERIATALFIQLKYIALLLFPHPLSWDYSYNQIPIIGLGNPKALAALAVIGALLFYAIKNFKKKDVLAYCILFYALSVVITSNLIVTIGATMAERFLFTASLAFCIAVVFLVARLFKTDLTLISYPANKTLFLVLGGLAIVYASKTMAQNEVWRNNTVLYESGIETAPDSWRTHYLLAVEYTRAISKTTDAAQKRELYTKAIQNFTESDKIMPNNAELFVLKGYAYEFGGAEDSALAAYAQAIKLDSTNKLAYNNMGAIYLRRGAFDRGIPILSKAIAIDSTYTDALTNLGASYGNKGLFKEAEVYYLRAVRINPDQPRNVFQSMTNIYKFMGDSANSQKYRALLNAKKE
jgi:hypothetical protein